MKTKRKASGGNPGLKDSVGNGLSLKTVENEEEHFRPEKLFLMIAVLVGSLLVFLTPPMAAPDENTHFINAYAVSKGNFFADVEKGQIGVNMPKAYADFIDVNLKKYRSFENKQTFTQYYFDSWLKQDLSQETFYATPLRNINPIGYLVSGLGMAIGDSFGRSFNLPYNLLVFGRIFNLIFYISVTYFALKITPKFKRTMLLLSLMPMSIFLAASLSYDAIVIPISFLLFAYALRLITAPEGYLITKKDIATVLFIAFFLGGVKVAYLPFLLVLLGVPQKAFGTKKRYFICIASVAAVGLAAYAVPAIANQVATRGVVLDSAKYAAMQKAYLESHLLEIPHIAFNTFKQFRLFYLAGFLGILGLLDTNFPVPVIIVFYLILLFTFLTDAFEAGHFKWNLKVLSLSAAVISILGMFYYMYINWTSLPNIVGVGADYVSGVQGRYLIPVALFVCLIFSNSLLQKHPFAHQSSVRRTADSIVFFTPVVLGLLTVATVLLRFWCS